MGPDETAAGFCGIVLAGGTAARMDGIDKAGLELGGRTLLEGPSTPSSTPTRSWSSVRAGGDRRVR